MGRSTGAFVEDILEKGGLKWSTIEKFRGRPAYGWSQESHGGYLVGRLSLMGAQGVRQSRQARFWRFARWRVMKSIAHRPDHQTKYGARR